MRMRKNDMHETRHANGANLVFFKMVVKLAFSKNDFNTVLKTHGLCRGVTSKFRSPVNNHDRYVVIRSVCVVCIGQSSLYDLCS